MREKDRGREREEQRRMTGGKRVRAYRGKKRLESHGHKGTWCRIEKVDGFRYKPTGNDDGEDGLDERIRAQAPSLGSGEEHKERRTHEVRQIFGAELHRRIDEHVLSGYGMQEIEDSLIDPHIALPSDEWQKPQIAGALYRLSKLALMASAYTGMLRIDDLRLSGNEPF